jgi:hypothetical protein
MCVFLYIAIVSVHLVWWSMNDRSLVLHRTVLDFSVSKHSVVVFKVWNALSCNVQSAGKRSVTIEETVNIHWTSQTASNSSPVYSLRNTCAHWWVFQYCNGSRATFGGKVTLSWVWEIQTIDSIVCHCITLCLWNRISTIICLTRTVSHKICSAARTNIPLFTESKATRNLTTDVSEPSHNLHKQFSQLKMRNIKCCTLCFVWVWNLVYYVKSKTQIEVCERREVRKRFDVSGR